MSDSNAKLGSYLAGRMQERTTLPGPRHSPPTPPHVLFLPKWWPSQADPQLGDFLRKQAQAVALKARVSVLYVQGITDPAIPSGIVIGGTKGLWEAHSRYRASALAFGPLRKAVNLVRYWRAAMAGWRLACSERGLPELIHVHIMVRPALVAWWASRRFGVPYIVSEQSSEYLDGSWAGKSALFKALNRYLFRSAGAVSAVSSFLGDALIKHRLCTHYAVVPNVVPGLDRPLPAPGGAGKFMVVADLVDRTKNVSGVLRAMAIAQGTQRDLDLTIIGDGPDRRKLEELANELGVGEHVRFMGRLPNSAVLDHMAQAGCVVINSNVETFSVVTGEALAQGKPVIATRCGGPTAFVTPENGVLIDVKDELALSKAMRSLASKERVYSPELIRQSVSSRFSPEAVGLAFVELYHRTLADHHG